MAKDATAFGWLVKGWRSRPSTSLRRAWPRPSCWQRTTASRWPFTFAELRNCDEWPWAEEAYDAVVAVFIQFADPALRERLFAHMVRTLKPGGVLVLQGYTPKQLDYKTGGPGVLSHLYSADLLRDAFASLQTIELVEYESELNEGAGRSALVGFVARKP